MAHLFLAITTITERASPTPARLIPLSLNEIRHLLTQLVNQRGTTITDRLRWYWWRRRHQYRAHKPTTSDNPTKTHEDHNLQLEY